MKNNPGMVLVVENNPDVRAMIGHYFENQGWVTLLESSFEGGLECLRTVSVDIVVTYHDVIPPHKDDCTQFVASARKMQPNTVIGVMCNSAGIEVLENISEDILANVQVVAKKPNIMEALAEMISAWGEFKKAS